MSVYVSFEYFGNLALVKIEKRRTHILMTFNFLYDVPFPSVLDFLKW